MFHHRYARIAFVILGAALAGQIADAQPKSKAASAGGFTQTCSHPSFPAATGDPIDTECVLTGSATAISAEGKQNKQKNNFCALPPASPAITVAQMVDLQKQVQMNPAINFGGSAHPLSSAKGPTTDRTPLGDLGEGKQRVLEGYIFIARQEGKESVNCETTPPNVPASHDIHISIVGDVSQVHGNECDSVVAEMSPHHRPTSWSAQNLQAVANKHLRVRVTGQLFFDSSHSPCVDEHPEPGDPHRASLWEIHPIYKFEVCPSGDCAGGTGWQALDAWVSKNGTGTNASNKK